MVPFCTASSTCSGGAISPAGKARVWKRLSVSSATRLLMVSAPKNRMSRFFGKLDCSRQRISGFWVWAMAGAARTGAAAAAPRMDRRFMRTWLPDDSCVGSVMYCPGHATHGRGSVPAAQRDLLQPQGRHQTQRGEAGRGQEDQGEGPRRLGGGRRPALGGAPPPPAG